MVGLSRLSWILRLLAAAATVVVCVAPLAAQTGAAKVLVMTGRVSVLRDSTEWGLNVGNVVQPKQVVITGPDGYAKFEISDGSTFEVFQNSRIVFRANPPSWGDLLDVLIGRVKVYIQHRNGPNPNRVNTQTAVISVRGTVFDVVVEDEDDTTLVTVDEGVVGVRHRLLPGETEVHQGESVRVFKNQPLARRVDRGSVARAALRAASQAVYDAIYRRPGGAGPTAGGGVPTGGTGAGGQADSGKKGGNTGGTGGGNAPGAPPPPPPAPPPAGGGN